KEGKVYGRDAGLREERQHRAGEALTQCAVKDRDCLRRAARHRVDDRATLGRRVRLLPKRDELDASRAVVQPHERRRNAIERCARHDPDGESRHRRTGGGSPTTGRTNPLADSSRRRASFASTLRRAMTIASFTLPVAPAIARRASSRDTPQTSITIRSPRSCSFALSATKSTIRLP